MFGFLIGTACLIGLIKVARHGRGCGRWGYGGYGGPWGHSHHHGGFGGSARRGGFGRTFWLRGAFERLQTTPGQEKVIVEAVDELTEIFRKARDEFRATRGDFAGVFRSETVDEASVSDIFLRHDTTLSETRRAAVEAIHRIHDALTEKQRAEVADFLENGPGLRGRGWGGRGWGGGRDGGPYRDQWA